MSSILLVEKESDLIPIKDQIIQYDHVIALTPRAEVCLEEINVPYFTLEDDSEVYNKLEETFTLSQKNLTQFIREADQLLHDLYPEIEIPLFKINHYLLRLPHDPIISSLFKLNLVVKNYQATKITLVRAPLKSSNGFRFLNTESILEKIIPLYFRDSDFEYHLIEGIQQKPTTIKETKVTYLHKVKLFIKKVLQYLPSKKCSYKILVSDSNEMNHAKKELLSMGLSLHNPQINIHQEKVIINIDKVISLLDEIGPKYFQYEGFVYWGIYKDKVHSIIKKFNLQISISKQLEDDITKSGIQLAIFGTHSGHNSVNTIAPFILEKNNIPFACWMHGGYGFYQENPGYDVSDYLFGQHYLTFGPAISSLVSSQSNLICHTLGSKVLETKRNLLKVQHTTKKPTITFTLGPWQQNSYLSGHKLREFYFNFWKSTKEIIDTLALYQDNYEIILRTLSDQDQNETVNKYLNIKGYHAVEVISTNQESLISIYQRTQLHILPWISTTFWEAALTPAKILIYDQTTISPEAKKAINSRAYHSEEIAGFCQKIKDILNAGNLTNNRSGAAFFDQYLFTDPNETVEKRLANIIQKITN